MRLNARQANARIEARLGRTAQDALEATAVLEAWGGLRPLTAMEMGAVVAEVITPSEPGEAATKPALDTRAGRGLALCAALFATLAWMEPLSSSLGPESVRLAWGLALPLGLGAQWGLRRRYLDGGPDGHGRLRNDWRSIALWSGAVLAVPTAALGTAGALAAILVLVWVSAFVVVERGWGFAFAAVLGSLGLVMRLEPPAWVDAGLLVLVAGVGLAVALSTSPGSTRLPGPWEPTIGAALTGSGIGTLIVFEAVDRLQGARPLPAPVVLGSILVASLWAGHHLGRIWDIADRPFDATLVGRSQSSRWATSVFFGSLARLAAGTIFAFSLVAAGASQHSLAEVAGILVLVWLIGLVSVICTLLEAVGRRAWSGAVVVGACAPLLAHGMGLLSWGVPPTVVGVGFGLAISLWPLLNLLHQPDRVLAVATL